MNCPNCNHLIDLPFEVSNCPECGHNLTIEENTPFINESNPFFNADFSKKVSFEKGALFLNDYQIEEFIIQQGYFSFYRVKKGDNYYFLQVALMDHRFTSYVLNEFEIFFKKYPSRSEIFLQLYLYGIDGDYIYYIFEYLPYNTLEQVIKSVPEISFDYLAQLTLFLIDFFSEAKKNGAHLFLYPQNIIHLGNNKFKILNYMISKFFAPTIQASSLFKKEVLPYLAPELTLSDNVIDGRADLYSIGKIIERLVKHDGFIQTEIPKWGNIESELKKFINQLIEREPEKRETSVDELKNSIYRMLEYSQPLEIVVEEELEPEDIAEIEHLSDDDLVLEEDMLTPPTIIVAPPEIKLSLMNDDDFKKAKLALSKDPLNRALLKGVFQYYVSKEQLDEAYIVSTILHFLNDSAESQLIFNHYKNLEWIPNPSLFSDDVWFKINPKNLYFNTSGMMLHLKQFLELSKSTIPPISLQAALSEELDWSTDKGRSILALMKIADLRNVKVRLAISDIGGQESLFSQIYKEDQDIILLLKKQIYESLDIKLFNAVLAKFLMLTSSDIVYNFLYDGAIIEEMFYGVLKYLVPSARNMHNSKVSNLVFKGMQDFVDRKMLSKNDIIKLVILINDHLYNRKSRPDVTESMKNIEITTDRFSLIATNDLNSVLKMFRDYENLGLGTKYISVKDRLRELLKFVLSDNYIQIRKHLGQSVI
ncbi:hypothetical protein JXR93_03380 [bacterium]|nr:hypothetical protein [bacterium]